MADKTYIEKVADKMEQARAGAEAQSGLNKDASFCALVHTNDVFKAKAGRAVKRAVDSDPDEIKLAFAAMATKAKVEWEQKSAMLEADPSALIYLDPSEHRRQAAQAVKKDKASKDSKALAEANERIASLVALLETATAPVTPVTPAKSKAKGKGAAKTTSPAAG